MKKIMLFLISFISVILFLSSCSLSENNQGVGNNDKEKLNDPLAICEMTGGTWEDTCQCPDGKIHHSQIVIRSKDKSGCMRCTEVDFVKNDDPLLMYADKDDCYDRLSRKENDTSYCSSIIDPFTRDSCISRIVSSNQDADLCMEMSCDANAFSCLTSIHGDLIPLEYCLELEDSLPRCVFEHVLVTGNISYCNYIKTDGFYKDACIIRYVEATRDYGRCNELTIQPLKYCIEINKYV